MDAVLILISWLILLVPGFDDSVPVTSDKVFKIETSPDMIQSITTRSDESLDFLGFDVELNQNSTGILEIKIPKNLPTPARFTNSWHHAENPIMLTDGTEIGYDIIPDPCYSHYKIPVEGETNLEILYPFILTGSWQLYSPTQFDENHSCYDKVFYEKPLESPLKQFESGTVFHEIKCDDGLQLTQKYDGSPACVKPETAFELIKRGWVSDIVLAVQSWDVFPLDPSTIPEHDRILDDSEFLQIKNNMENIGYHICDVHLEGNKILIVLNWIYEDSEPEKMILSQIPPDVSYEIKYLGGYADYFISKESVYLCEGLENED